MSTLLDLVAGRSGHFRRHRVEDSGPPLSWTAGGGCPPQAQLVAQALGVEFCFTELMPNQSRGLYAARYRLPRALADRVRGKRLAIVDDVMSAGSALRGTYAELTTLGAMPVVAGALIVLGTAGANFFAQQRIPVEAVARKDYALWPPVDCPLCIAGVPLVER